MLTAIEKYRLPISAGLLVLFLAWETANPFFAYFRGRPAERRRHGFRNLIFGAFNALLIPFGFVAAWTWAARTHHSDPQMDVTTATRLHVGEIAHCGSR